METKEFWRIGDKVKMLGASDRIGIIVDYPKVHNAAIASVLWEGNKRKMRVPLPLLKVIERSK